MVEIDIVDKITDLIVVLVGAGIGWFIAQKLINATKHSAFDLKFTIALAKENVGAADIRPVEYALKNSSTVLAYDVKLEIFFRSRIKQTIKAEYHKMEAFQTIKDKSSILTLDDITPDEFFNLVERFEVHYVTEYGYKRQFISKTITFDK